MNNYVAILRTLPQMSRAVPHIYVTFQSRPDFAASWKTARARSWLGRLLRGAECHFPHGSRNELEINARGRTHRRVPGHIRANPIRHGSCGDGGAVPHA